MRFQGLTSYLLAMGLTGMLHSVPHAFANGSVTSAPTPSPTAQPESRDSFLRRNLHGVSFDESSDQLREVERQGNRQMNHSQCVAPERLTTQAAKDAWLGECRALIDKVNREGGNVSAVAGRTAREQEIMADISRVSDVAAVAAIGATAVGQFAMRDQSQAKSLEKVANIQTTAGKAAYVTGATDLTLGAYAYLAQKRRLENLQANLRASSAAQGETITVEQSSVSGLQASIEKTKQAAYKHMLMGAAKVGTGWMSMQMAKGNKQAADNLRSLQAVQAQQAQAQTSTISGNGTAPTYTNNTPTFSIPNSTGSSGSTDSIARGGGAAGISSLGSSSLPMGAQVRAPAAASPGGISGPGGSGGGDNKRDGTGASAMPMAAAGNEKASEAMGSNFELNLTGGGGSRYSGGGGKEGGGDEAGAIAGVFANLLGQNNQAPGNPTLINPEQLTQGADYDEGGVQGEREGVNGSNRSLWELSRAKHFKMLQAGRLAGPGEVISR